MKRQMLLAGAGALCMLALFAIYCTQVEFDNPLDEKEKGAKTPDKAWLWELDKNPNICADKNIYVPDGFRCPEYIRDTYFKVNDSIKNDWQMKLGGCVGMDDFTISVVPPREVTIKDNQTSEFLKWMGTNGWGGVLELTGDPEPPTVELRNTQGTVDKTKMPPPGNYTIIYTVKKKKCGSDEYLPSKSEDRVLRVEKYTADNTTPPGISICQQFPTELTVGDTTHMLHRAGGDAGCVSSTEGGSTPVRAINGVSPGTLSTAAPASFTVTYTTTKTLVRNGVEKDTSVSVTRTVTVKEAAPPPTSAVPVIVLNNCTYNIGGKQFSWPDTAFASGGVYMEKGVARAYYVDAAGEHNIAVNLVKITPPGQIEGENQARYTVDEVAGQYKTVTTSRSVYILRNDCNAPPEPTISFAGDGDNPLTIPSSTRWAWKTSFNVGSVLDGTPDNMVVRSHKFGVDSGGLNPDSPKPGTYTITYIGLGGCTSGANGLRFFRSEPRTIIVQ